MNIGDQPLKLLPGISKQGVYMKLGCLEDVYGKYV